MLKFIHPLRWWIWPTIFGLISSFIRDISQLLPHFGQSTGTLVDEEQGDQDRCLPQGVRYDTIILLLL